jgi:hypothetical protein
MALFSMMFLGCFSPELAFAGDGYRLPPSEVVEVVDAPRSPSLTLSPDGRWFIGIEPDPMPSIADVSRPMLRLAGMRIDPTANGRHRTSFSRALFLRDLTGKTVTPVAIPDGARLVGARWSHTSRHFAYTLLTESGTSLWVAPVSDPTLALKISDRISSVLTSGYYFSPDGASVIITEVPADRGAPPINRLCLPAPASAKRAVLRHLFGHIRTFSTIHMTRRCLATTPPVRSIESISPAVRG